MIEEVNISLQIGFQGVKIYDLKNINVYNFVTIFDLFNQGKVFLQRIF